MRLATAAIVTGALALTLTACQQRETQQAPAASAPKVAETPKRKPGLWIQTTHAEGLGAFPPIAVCIDRETDSKMAWWGQQAVRGGCARNDVKRNPDGSWSFESVCQTEGNIRTSSKGTASGDFNSAYAVDVETTTEGAPIPDLNGTRKVTMAFEWQGDCPADMKPGDMRLPDGSVVNMLEARGPVPTP